MHNDHIFDLILAFLIDFYIATIYTIEKWDHDSVTVVFKILNFTLIFMLFIKII